MVMIIISLIVMLIFYENMFICLVKGEIYSLEVKYNFIFCIMCWVLLKLNF